MKPHPPGTILEFLERAGVRFGWTPRGKLVFMTTDQTRPLTPLIQASLPVIERDLLARQAREALARRTNGTAAPGPGPARSPRLNQLRVTNYFRGMNQVEGFMGEAAWRELCWVKRARDGRKVGAQILSRLSADTEPAGGKRISLEGSDGHAGADTESERSGAHRDRDRGQSRRRA